MNNTTGTTRVLAVSNLFPNEFEPQRGLFNLNQFRALAAAGAGVRVVAPVPVFPGMGLAPRLATSGRAARVPRSGEVDGLSVWYPRYPYVPVLGREIHGWLYYRGTRGGVGRIVDLWKPHVVYATWTWPDAFAAGLLARDAGLPYVVKVHGTDVNEYLKLRWRRPRILSALNNAAAVVSVSDALKQRMAAYGVDPGKIRVIYNGVERARYRPRPRDESRRRLGIETDAPAVVFVGNLKPVKGLKYLLSAFATVREKRPGARLHLIGRGPLEADLRKRAVDLGLDDAVRLEGEQSPAEVARWMNAADVLCLPSVNEGVPNVLLEAMACGTPVVASNVGGIPEVVDPGACGYLVPPGDPGALAESLDRALGRDWDRERIGRRADRFSWERNAAALLEVLSIATEARG